MVLVVVADVEAEHVQWPVVTVGLLALVEHVMLGDKVTSYGVDTHGEQRASSKVEESAH